MTRWILLLFAMLATSAAVPPPAGIPGKEAEEEAPKANLVVSMERHSMRDGDINQVDLWFSNDSDRDFTGATLQIDSPAFLEWHADNLKGPSVSGTLPLGTIAAHSVIERQFLIRTTPSVDIGDFDILLALEYHWLSGAEKGQGFSTAEEPIQVNFLGVDSIAGIPISLAALIVPGMFFWLVLSLLGVSGKVGSGTGDNLIYSIIMSVVCLGLCAGLRLLLSRWLDLGYFDIRSPVSIPKLLALALVGFLLGVCAGAIVLEVRRRRRNSEKGQLIGPNDRPADIVEKILVLNADYRGVPVVVRLKDGTEFMGAHWAPSVDATFLVGSFEVLEENIPANTKAEIKGLFEKAMVAGHPTGSDLISIVKKIKSCDPELVGENSPIFQLKDQTKTETRRAYLQWKNDEVSGVTRDYEQNMPLLILS